jgi:ABC-2 type transport system ATP-binding protein
MTGMPSHRVDQVLAAVGLTGAAGRRVGTYSLGMRQRLGLAQALVGEPSVLILDEPATGLDPEGIAWIRGLLRDFAGRRGTVLLSSHLLAEVQATADHLVVINAGRIVAAGALSDLLAASGLMVRAGDQTALQRLLAQHGVPSTRAPGGALQVDTSTGVSAAQIAALAVTAGLSLLELRPAQHAELEDLFFALTSPPAGTGGGAPAPEVPR